MSHSPGSTTGASASLARLDAALEQLEQAPAFAKARYQEPTFAAASDLLDSDAGLRALFERAARFDNAGLFHGGPWEDVTKLLPHLVRYGLLGDGLYSTVEALSELRLLSIASGAASHADLTADEAQAFLCEVCVRSLDLMFPGDSEARRMHPKLYARAERLLALVRDHVPLGGLLHSVMDEIEVMTVQFPVRHARIEELVRQAENLPAEDGTEEDAARLQRFRQALGATTQRAHEAGSPVAYRSTLARSSEETLVEECRTFVDSVRSTGLTSPFHAVALRTLARRAPHRLDEAIGVDEVGAAQVAKCEDLVRTLVTVSVFPTTHRTIIGLLGVLERGLLTRQEVAGGLRRLMQLDILPAEEDRLLRTQPEGAGLSANSILLSGTLLVLGLPLGVGQGNSPTCQAARGLSLWSLHAPGMLLAKIAGAARDGFITAEFEGQSLRSDQCVEVRLEDATDPDMDPVSVVLVPHLDRLYNTMLSLAAGRNADPHRWVNPSLYGRWVAQGFASALDPGAVTISHHPVFVRRFFATHHPDYNDGHELIYPNPVGLMVTDVHGRLLGPHAVSIQRIALDADDVVRVYFFNPNDEGRQDWGGGVEPSVVGHGERAGESSLPFPDFAARLYAFHFDPQEEGDAYAVPEDEVREISQHAAETWGRAYTWIP
jgi:hypothetical protein